MDEHIQCGKLGPADSRDKLIVDLRRELEEAKSDLAVTTQMLVLSIKLSQNKYLSAKDLAVLVKAAR